MVLLPKGTATQQQLTTLEDVAVAEMVAHALGSSTLRPEQSAHFVKDTVFAKKRANALFVVESLGADELAAFPALRMLARADKPLMLTETAALQDRCEATHFFCFVVVPSLSHTRFVSIALITTLSSGMTVSEHGIVGSAWFRPDGSKVAAFSTSDTTNLAGNLADRLSHAFRGESLVVAASSSFQAASALGGHPSLVEDHPYWETYALHWNPDTTRFESVYGVTAASRTHAALQVEVEGAARFAHLVHVLGATRDHDEHGLTLHGDAGTSASFSHRAPAELAFLAEVELVLATVAALRDDAQLNRLARDNVPDSLSFCFASLRDLRAYFPPTSKTFQVALQTLDRAISHALDTLELVYGRERLLWEVLLVDQSGVMKQAEAVINRVTQQLAETDTLAYGIDVFSRLADPQRVCDKLNALVASQGLLAVCPVSHAVRMAASSSAAVPHAHDPLALLVSRLADLELEPRALTGNNSLPGSSAGDAEQLARFHLLFWTVVVLLLLFVGGASLIGSLEIPADSQLLRNLPDIYKSQAGSVMMRELQ